MQHSIQVAYFQMAGQGKHHNQDALFNGVAVKHAKLNKARWVNVPETPVRIAVADGVFSSEAPHLASRFWMQAFQQHGDGQGRFLRSQHPAFCDALIPKFFGSATTFASAHIDDEGQCQVCNIGDSRVYRISADGQWTQISHDHTVLAEMIERGEADANIEYSGIYHHLADCLTADYDDTEFKIFRMECALSKGEAVLVCTDGLSDGLEHSQLEQIWCEQNQLVDKLYALQHAVWQVKRHDDCSVVCALFLGNTP